jgi:hypothetical protein
MGLLARISVVFVARNVTFRTLIALRQFISFEFIVWM